MKWTIELGGSSELCLYAFVHALVAATTFVELRYGFVFFLLLFVDDSNMADANTFRVSVTVSV